MDRKINYGVVTNTKRESDKNMKKKIIPNLILLVAIVAVAIFTGCIEEEAPTSTPTPTLDTIKIDVTSTTWREGEKPYDIHSAMEEKLKKAGFRVVPKGSDVYNATLFVNYREEKGSEYYEGFGSDVFAGYGTNIECYIQLEHKDFGLLFTKEITASTPFSAYNLYEEALQEFENKVYFKYLGEIIASKYEAGSEVPVIISALINDEKSDTRADAAEVLGDIGDKRAVEPLIDALRDADYTVQWSAAEALGKIGDKRAVEPLITTLKTGDEYLRKRAAEALGDIGDKRAVEPLINALKDEDESVRSSAAEALGNIGDVRAVEPLIDALKDEDWYVQYNAAKALGEIEALGEIIFLPPSLMTDKDIYRPGETVKITYKNAPPDGSLIISSFWGGDSKDWDVSGNGTITYTIPENATLGEWTVYLFGIWTNCSVDKDILIVPIPKDYYSKADELVPDPQIHSIQALYDTLMNVKLPNYNRSSFRCSHAAAYLEWYLEGAGFNASIVYGLIPPQADLHAWVWVELPEGSVAIEATWLCEDNYHPPGIIIDPEHKFEKYSSYYRDYLDYLDKYGTGEYILPKDFNDFMENYMVKEGQFSEDYIRERYYDYMGRYNDIYEDYESAYESIEGMDWWNVEPFCSQLNWSTSCRRS